MVVDDGALGLLVNLFVIYCETCDVCDIYVMLDICAVDDIYVMLVMFVIYIFCLFGWDEKTNKKAVFSHFAECNGHDTRQSDDLRTCLGTCFAECKGHCTRQTSQICRVPWARHSAKVACLPSVLPVALGTVATFAECLSQRRSAKRRPLPSA